MKRQILGDRKKIRYDEGLVDKVNKQFANNEIGSLNKKTEEDKLENSKSGDLPAIGTGIQGMFEHLTNYLNEKANEDEKSLIETFHVDLIERECENSFLGPHDVYLLHSSAIDKRVPFSMEIGVGIHYTFGGPVFFFFPVTEREKKFCEEYIEKYSAEWKKQQVHITGRVK